MQTFLPYADFERSARVLDAKRLGKQRVVRIRTQAELADAGALPPWLEAERRHDARSRAAKKAWETRRRNAAGTSGPVG